MSGRIRLRHQLEYAGFRLISGACNAAPEGLADRAGGSLGWLAARFGRPRWEVVTAQIAAAFPEADESWRRDIARRCYAHLGAESVAMFRLARMGARKIRERTQVVGLELLEQATGEGRGVALVSGHVGNWEVGAAAIAARGLPVDVVVARQRNPLFDARLTEARQGLGLTVIPRGEARPRVLASFRAGRIVGLMGDQDARGAGVFVDFFGRPAATARGPAVLAIRTGAAMVTCFSLRIPGRPPRYEVRIEAVEVPSGSRRTGADGRHGGMAADVITVTQSFTHRLEELVRERPEQYFWHHRRWKTPPPGETPAQPKPPATSVGEPQADNSGAGEPQAQADNSEPVAGRRVY